MKIVPLSEGIYSIGLDKKLIPFDPKIDKATDRKGSLIVHIQPFLVDLDGETYLFDTGLGYRHGNSYHIIENLRLAGYKPESVKYVCMSHLHFDHSNGMTDEAGVPLFPNARYIIQRQELDNAKQNQNTYLLQKLSSLERNNCLLLVEGNGHINAQLSYQHTGGHCPFHQSFLLTDGYNTVYYGGDIVPDNIQMNMNFIAKYDTDGRKSQQIRQEVLEAACQNNWLLLFFHAKDMAVGKVVSKDGKCLVEKFA